MSNNFSILTHNLWLLNTMKENNPPKKKERVEAFLSNLQSFKVQFDIICIQECFIFANPFFKTLFDNSYRDRIVSFGKENLGLKYACISDDPPFMLFHDSGLLILSRFPVIKRRNLVFKNSSWNDYVICKGVLYGAIEKKEDNSLTHVFTLHTDAHNEEIREKQIEEMTDFMVECMSDFGKSKKESQSNRRKSNDDTKYFENQKIVIAGDFNIDSRTDEYYPKLISILNKRVCNKMECFNEFEFKDMAGDRVESHPITCYGMCLDHILVTIPKQHAKSFKGNFETVEWILKEGNQGMYISDHTGLSCNIEN